MTPVFRFRNAPIRRKLMIMIMLTTATAMLLACFGILVSDSILFRTRLQRDLEVLARITAQNSAASLEFNDPRSAASTLSALTASSHIVNACIYGTDGVVMASYVRATSGKPCPQPDYRDESHFSSGDLTISYGIVLRDQRVGTLMMDYDLGEIAERRRLYGTVVICVLIVSSLVAFLFSGGLRALIAEPISQLATASKSVSETGDYGIRAKKISDDELGVLADAFNDMLAGIQSRDNSLTQALSDREEALEDADRAHKRFRFLAESMPQKIFTALPGGQYDYFNGQWSEFSGFSVEDLQARGLKGIIHPDDLDAGVQIWRQALASGEPFQMQHRLRRADGEYRWHLTRVHAMSGPSGAIAMWIGSVTDFHEQKEKEQALRRANEDLQQFAYSASHDLQEPIRNVTIYSDILGRRYGHLLDADGKQFLGFLTEGGRRTAMLINDLLEYTRAGSGDGDVSPQSASAVLKVALSGLAEAIRESGAVVTCDALPEVNMHEVHLRQLFQNLIGNAIKYRMEEPPRIHISASDQGAEWRFSIRDNGIGIDPQYKEKIFGVFKRLHRDKKYSGTGVGLAICQRVVERYGGRIWVDSAIGRGSTFHFTVPREAETGAWRTAAQDTHG